MVVVVVFVTVSQKQTPNIDDPHETVIQPKQCNKSKNKGNKKTEKNTTINPEKPD